MMGIFYNCLKVLANGCQNTKMLMLKGFCSCQKGFWKSPPKPKVVGSTPAQRNTIRFDA